MNENYEPDPHPENEPIEEPSEPLTPGEPARNPIIDPPPTDPLPGDEPDPAPNPEPLPNSTEPLPEPPTPFVLV